jgi:hypothetical protein
MRFYKSWWKLTKATIFHNIFFRQITYFCSVSFDYDVLFAFRNFVPWWTKFFCLLLYGFASRQHRQIFRHRQMIGDISNIAETYQALLIWRKVLKMQVGKYKMKLENVAWELISVIDLNHRQFWHLSKKFLINCVFNFIILFS